LDNEELNEGSMVEDEIGNRIAHNNIKKKDDLLDKPKYHSVIDETPAFNMVSMDSR
jgi:hypothetical protein